MKNLIKALKFPITSTDVQIKRAMTAVKQLIFRLPDVSKGHVMRPYKVVLDALPAECNTQKLLIETSMGLSGYMITAMAMKTPPWSQFQNTIVATIMGARASSGKACTNVPNVSPPQGSSSPQSEALALLTQAKAEAQALVSQAKTDVGKLKGNFSGKCWFCAGTHGDPKHACADCKAPKCPDCGKMICGFARGIPCMVKNGIPEGAQGADGQPIAAHIKKRINEAKVLTPEAKAKLAAAKPTALVSQGTTFRLPDEPATQDPMGEDDDSNIFQALALISAVVVGYDSDDSDDEMPMPMLVEASESESDYSSDDRSCLITLKRTPMHQTP